MGLFVFSALLSIILASCLWLLLGSRLPWRQEDKWPVPYNILCYAGMVLVPLYALIFFIYQEG